VSIPASLRPRCRHGHAECVLLAFGDLLEWGMLGNCAAFPYHGLSIKSEPDMLRLRQPSAMRHGGTPSRRMRQTKESAK
jgi:hypothetical protein